MHNSGFTALPASAADFSAPLAMLAACHDRLARQCATLRRLVLYLGECGPDEQARAAAQGVLRYFDTSVPQHHADEEDDLFPTLIESMAGSDAVCLRELTEGLVQEHRTLERAWWRLRQSLELVADGGDAPLAAAQVEAFVSRYLEHIAREDSELMPMAQRLLTDDELARIGQGMRRRRETASGQAAR